MAGLELPTSGLYSSRDVKTASNTNSLFLEWWFKLFLRWMVDSLCPHIIRIYQSRIGLYLISPKFFKVRVDLLQNHIYWLGNLTWNLQASDHLRNYMKRRKWQDLGIFYQTTPTICNFWGWKMEVWRFVWELELGVILERIRTKPNREIVISTIERTVASKMPQLKN